MNRDDCDKLIEHYCSEALKTYILLYGEDRLKEKHFDQTTTETSELALYFMDLDPRPTWFDEMPRKFADEDEEETMGLINKEGKIVR